MDRDASRMPSRARLRPGVFVAAMAAVAIGVVAPASAAQARPSALTGSSDCGSTCGQAQVGSLELACVPGGIEISLSDAGTVPTDVVVLEDGTDVQDVTVDADGTVTATVPLGEGETATITVVSDGVVLTTQTVTLHCLEATTTGPSTTAPTSSSTSTPTLGSVTTENPNRVLGVSLERDPATTNGTLPTTGTNSTLLIAIGGVLVFAGACIVVAARRQA